jgi:hypothetical protein
MKLMMLAVLGMGTLAGAFIYLSQPVPQPGGFEEPAGGTERRVQPQLRGRPLTRPGGHLRFFRGAHPGCIHFARRLDSVPEGHLTIAQRSTLQRLSLPRSSPKIFQLILS